jgi:aspartyl aminopeptidase
MIKKLFGSLMENRIHDFLKFLSNSPSPFHAVENMVKKLEESNFTRLRESCSKWDLESGGRYYVTRNGSSLVAFTVPNRPDSAETPLVIIGAHSDSPCLKLKVNSQKSIRDKFCQVAVETYGGGIWSTWFDRDLGVAGRFLYSSTDEEVKEKLVNINYPLFRIPNLAIHLDRSINEGFKFNPEIHLMPLYGLVSNSMVSSSNTHLPFDLGKKLMGELANEKTNELLGHDLCLYEVSPACLGGLNEEFIISGRLDNLFMSYCALHGIIEAEQSNDALNVVAIFDNEEVGSLSPQGADSNFLPSILERVSQFYSPGKGLLISADMAHAAHPNYSDKHDNGHRPEVNGGLVIKSHSGCRYATTSRVAAALRSFCNQNDIPVQEFMVRNDSPCGSTIGPILSAKIGIPAVDVGMAQLAMHSIREMAGSDDLVAGVNFCTQVFQDPTSLLSKLIVD